MSHFSEISLSFSNRETLIECLIKCWGFTREQIEVHDEPQQIYDYHGKPTTYRYQDTADQRFIHGDVAHVIIRREHVGGSSNDIGFYIEANPDENKQSIAFISDYDRGRARTNDEAMANLTQAYVVKETKDEYAAEGKEVIEQEHNGEILLYVRAG